MELTDWIIVAVLIAVSMAFAYFMFTRESRMLGQLAVALGGVNNSSVLGGNYVSVDSQGSELQIRLMSGSSDSGYGAQLIILRKTPPPFRMQISSSSWAARIGNAVGLVEDITAGDPSVDKRYRIRASDREEAIGFVNDQQRREAMAYFFDQGFTDIRLAENDVFVIKPQDLKSDLDSDVMKRHLEHFEMLFSTRRTHSETANSNSPIS
jgi:hypothetical protein